MLCTLPTSCFGFLRYRQYPFCRTPPHNPIPHVVELGSSGSLWLLPLYQFHSLDDWVVKLEPHFHTDSGDGVSEKECGIDTLSPYVDNHTSKWLNSLLTDLHNISRLQRLWVVSRKQLLLPASWVQSVDLLLSDEVHNVDSGFVVFGLQCLLLSGLWLLKLSNAYIFPYVSPVGLSNPYPDSNGKSMVGWWGVCTLLFRLYRGNLDRLSCLPDLFPPFVGSVLGRDILVVVRGIFGFNWASPMR